MNDIIKIAEITRKATEILGVEKTRTNLETKVTVSLELDECAKIFRVVDQTSLIRPKKAKIIIYPDGTPHGEYSGFKDEADILNSLNR